jgi:hypothetical protein
VSSAARPVPGTGHGSWGKNAGSLGDVRCDDHGAATTRCGAGRNVHRACERGRPMTKQAALIALARNRGELDAAALAKLLAATKR